MRDQLHKMLTSDYLGTGSMFTDDGAWQDALTRQFHGSLARRLHTSLDVAYYPNTPLQRRHLQ